MSAPVEQIKSRLGIVEVVSGDLKLEKAGINFKACCPFHNEKTPSFFVSPARETYHCFGCQKGGDIFSFVQEIEGLDFVGALKNLATRAGVELSSVDRQENSEKEMLYRALEMATSFYEEKLKDNRDALNYFKDRGLSEELIKKWRLGLAPAGWRNLYQELHAKRFTDEVMMKAGLVIKPEQGKVREASPYDRFRERLMFPLFDPAGRPIGFSGRVFGPNPPENTGKYVNSPETALYQKSKFLYGYDRAKVAIRREEVAVLVEGQMDLLLSHQVGVENAVAVSGTALTEEHLKLLKRLTTNLVFAFDGDLAGFRAAKRGVEMALQLGFEVRVVELPLGLDPADLAKQDPALWQKAVRETKHVIDFLLEVLARGADKRTLARTVQKEVYPYLLQLANRLDRAHFIKKIAQVTDLSEGVITADLAQFRLEGPMEKKILSPSVGASSRLKRLAERLFGLFLLAKRSPAKELAETNYAELVAGLATQKEALLLQAEGDDRGAGFETTITDLVHEFQREFWRESLAKATQELKLAENAQDEVALEKWLKICQDVSSRLNQLN